MKKLLVGLLTICLSLSILAGCSSGNDGAATTTKESSAVSAVSEEKKDDAASEEKQETQKQASGETVTLQYMTLQDGSMFEAEKKVFDNFMEKNPGIIVEATSVPGVDTFITALKAKFAAGEEPDLYSFQAGTRVREFAQAGLLKDITDEPYMDRVYEEDKSFNSLNGRIYAVPTRYEFTGLFVNNEVLAQYPNVSIPENFQELMEACEQFREDGMEYPMLLAGKDINNVSQVDFQYLSTVVVPNIPDYYVELMNGDRKFSDPFIVEMFDKYGQIVEYVTEDRLGVDNDEAIKRFIRGDGAFWIAHGSTIPRIREMAGEEFDFSLYPSVLQDEGEERYFNVGQALALAVVESTEYPDEVRALITEYVSPESCDIIAIEGKAMPSLKDSNVLPDSCLENAREWFDTDKKTPHADLVWVPGIKDIMKEITQTWLMGEPLDSVLDEWETQHRRLLDANPEFIENFGKE